MIETTHDHTIDEYTDYLGMSEFVRQNSTYYQPRSWVPRWLWRLVANEVITPLQISAELQAAGKQALDDLAREQFVLSHEECNLSGPFSVDIKDVKIALFLARESKR
jgi:hypothetical protein